jgi:hypothetical protein
MNAPEDKPQWFTIGDGLLWPLIGMGVATARSHRLRTRPKVNLQWNLYCLVHNIEKLAHHGYKMSLAGAGFDRLQPSTQADDHQDGIRNNPAASRGATLPRKEGFYTASLGRGAVR